MKLNLTSNDIGQLASIKPDLNNLKTLNQQERKVLKAVYKHIINKESTDLEFKISRKDQDIAIRIQKKLQFQDAEPKQKNAFEKFAAYIGNLFGRVSSAKLNDLAKQAYIRPDIQETENDQDPDISSENLSISYSDIGLREDEIPKEGTSDIDLGNMVFTANIDLTLQANADHEKNLTLLNTALSDIDNKKTSIEIFNQEALTEALSGELEQINQQIEEFKEQVELYRDNPSMDYGLLEDKQTEIDTRLDTLDSSCKDYLKEKLKQEKQALIDTIQGNLPLLQEAIHGEYLPTEIKQEVNQAIDTASKIKPENQTLDGLQEIVKRYANLVDQVSALKNNNIEQLEQTLSQALDDIESSLNSINAFRNYAKISPINIDDTLKGSKETLSSLVTKQDKNVKEFKTLQKEIAALQQKAKKARTNAKGQLTDKINKLMTDIKQMLTNVSPEDMPEIKASINKINETPLESKNIEELIETHKITIESKHMINKSHFKKLAAAKEQLISRQSTQPKFSSLSNDLIGRFEANGDFISTSYNESIANLNTRLEEYTLQNPLLNFPSDTNIENLSNKELDILLNKELAKINQFSQVGKALLQEYAQCNQKFIIDFSNQYAAIFNLPENPIFFPLMPIHSQDDFSEGIRNQSNLMEAECALTLDDMTSPDIMHDKLTQIQKHTLDYFNLHEEYAVETYKAFNYLAHALDFAWLRMTRYGSEPYPDYTHYYSLKDWTRETTSWEQAKQIDIYQTNESGQYLTDSDGKKLPSYSKNMDKTYVYIEHAKRIHENMRDQIHELDDEVVNKLLNKKEETTKLYQTVTRNIAYMTNDEHKTKLNNQLNVLKEVFEETFNSLSDPKEKLLTKIVFEGTLSRIFQQVMQSMAGEEV